MYAEKKTYTRFRSTFLRFKTKPYTDEAIQHAAVSVNESFITPEPQKTTEGMNKKATANSLCNPGYSSTKTLYKRHIPPKQTQATRIVQAKKLPGVMKDIGAA
jgi:hypothetical protein